MAWVYAAIAVGLVGILVEVVLSFRRQAAQLEQEQEHERRLISVHRAALAELQDKRQRAEAHIGELRESKKKLAGELDWQRQELVDLEARAERRHIGSQPRRGEPPQ